MATLIFVIGAIVVDFGLWFTERRRAQTAADAAAIAAATELGDDAAVIALGMDYAGRNGYADDAGGGMPNVVVTPDYNGDPDKVEVTVEDDAPLLFLDIFSLGAFDIGARAVASETPSTAVYAIFVDNDSCSTSDPFIMGGSDATVTGLVHSNSDAQVSGSNNDFNGEFTHSCDFTNNGSNNSYDPAVEQDGNRDAPVEFSFNQFPCTFTYTEDTDLSSRPEAWVDFSTKTEMVPGVYCSTKKLVLSAQNATANVTLVAGGPLDVSGSNFSMTPYWNNVLLFSSLCCPGDDAIKISASGGDWVGIINAPDGKVEMSGSENASDSFDLYGSIVADRVSISGQDFTITAAFVSADAAGIRLIE
jgi:Putative Flp pilus-assembly TadE/G-like